eukprot:m.56643 g.56643  ORF g.56643 m.56643 type:complete len:110 (+) comp11050_c0_seq2:230-559(+)
MTAAELKLQVKRVFRDVLLEIFGVSENTLAADEVDVQEHSLHYCVQFRAIYFERSCGRVCNFEEIFDNDKVLKNFFAVLQKYRIFAREYISKVSEVDCEVLVACVSAAY